MATSQENLESFLEDLQCLISNHRSKYTFQKVRTEIKSEQLSLDEIANTCQPHTQFYVVLPDYRVYTTLAAENIHHVTNKYRKEFGVTGQRQKVYFNEFLPPVYKDFKTLSYVSFKELLHAVY